MDFISNKPNIEVVERSKDEILKSVNKFNRIDTPTHYAIDINKNGKVDEGEVFTKTENSLTMNF
jgi:hypothetical protein